MQEGANGVTLMTTDDGESYGDSLEATPNHFKGSPIVHFVSNVLVGVQGAAPRASSVRHEHQWSLHGASPAPWKREIASANIAFAAIYSAIVND